MKTLVVFAFLVALSSVPALAADGKVSHSSLAKMGLLNAAHEHEGNGDGSFGQLRLAKGLSALGRTIVIDIKNFFPALQGRSPGGTAGGKS